MKHVEAILIVVLLLSLWLTGLTSCQVVVIGDNSYGKAINVSLAYIELWYPRAKLLTEKVEPKIEARGNTISITWTGNESEVYVELIKINDEYVVYLFKIYGLKGKFNEFMYTKFLSTLIKAIDNKGELVKASEVGIDSGDVGRRVTYMVKNLALAGALTITEIYPDVIVVQDMLTPKLIEYASSKGLVVHVPSIPLSAIKTNKSMTSITGISITYKKYNNTLYPITIIQSESKRIEINLYNGQITYEELPTQTTKEAKGNNILWLTASSIIVVSIIVCITIIRLKHKRRSSRRRKRR